VYREFTDVKSFNEEISKLDNE
ncbi:MAG: transcriptional regulator NrdR, partial [Finegoldia magna]|nr:transcriptional regulator NrdR [Finegoldia magna]